MSITTTVHLNFQDRARAALEFYQGVFGGQLAVVTYADAHDVQHPADADRVLWGQVQAEDGFHVMAYDVRESQSYAPGDRAYFVSVRGSDAAEITRYWQGLADGATVVQDLAPSGWAPLSGMLTDRFGVTWVLDVAVAYDPS
jgi:PhnB protein